jgi:hypothetical protein
VAHLAFAVGPEVGHHADDVVESRVGALVDEESTQCAQWVHDQACLDGAVQSSAGDEGEWVFHGDATESKDQVHDLQDGEGLDGAVEVLCEEVPEDLWPEEGLESSSNLVWVRVLVSHDMWNGREIWTYKQQPS